MLAPSPPPPLKFAKNVFRCSLKSPLSVLRLPVPPLCSNPSCVAFTPVSLCRSCARPLPFATQSGSLFGHVYMDNLAVTYHHQRRTGIARNLPRPHGRPPHGRHGAINHGVICRYGCTHLFSPISGNFGASPPLSYNIHRFTINLYIA